MQTIPFLQRMASPGRGYFVKTPWWVRKIYSNYIWDIRAEGKIIYLTFDDGPHPIATPFVLDLLKRHKAKASFFCRGSNVVQYPDIYQRITREGHTVGNHSHTHPDGWKTPDELYFADIKAASDHIHSNLFRPPYGRITMRQAKKLKTVLGANCKIIMWSLLSGDFDNRISRQKCLENVLDHARPGAIVVFHDSEKAFQRLAYALPLVLKNFEAKGYQFQALESDL